MTTKKSPFDNPEPIPERTQESIFGVSKIGTMQEEIDKINSVSSRSITVPAGHEVIVFRKSFSPSLLEELETLTTSVEALTPVASQADVEAQNTILKKASKFMTRFETERKAMGEPLKNVTDELLQIQKNTLATILELVTDKNTEIVNFQKQESKRAAAKQAEIQKQRDKEIQDAQAEANRKQNILNLIAQFENNVLTAISAATIDTIDNLILHFDGFKIKKESYQEYTDQALELQGSLRIKFIDRKSELEKLAELEKTNKLQADQLRLQQEQKSALDKQAAITRDAQQRNEASEQLQSDIANTQMQSEFATSQISSQKNVMKKMVFDPEQINIAALPLKYHTFDAAKIQADITAGAKSIPGVVIVERISNVKR